MRYGEGECPLVFSFRTPAQLELLSSKPFLVIHLPLLEGVSQHFVIPSPAYLKSRHGEKPSVIEGTFSTPTGEVPLTRKGFPPPCRPSASYIQTESFGIRRSKVSLTA